MKSRIVFFLFLVTLLSVLLAQNSKSVRNVIIRLINPVKTNYNRFSTHIENMGQSYIFQKETIERLSRENRVLRRYLLDQTNYLRQISAIYKKLPTLERLPYRSIVLVDTISYVKLNKFNEILLTKPSKRELKEGGVYGLIQDEVVAGIARMDHGNLYGYLLSNPECRFGVYIGKERIPGIAFGLDRDGMEVRFIPKWAEIEVGDRVETSGLDDLFFANIPVGIVEKVIVEESYKKAFISTYADTMHPGLFFLITDPRPYLSSFYDQNLSFPDEEYAFEEQKPLKRDRNISSVPMTVQTKELEIDPGEFEIPKEPVKPIKPPSVYRKKPKNGSRPSSPKLSETVSGRKKSVERKSVTVSAPKPKKREERRERPKEHPSPFDILNIDRY